MASACTSRPSRRSRQRSKRNPSLTASPMPPRPKTIASASNSCASAARSMSIARLRRARANRIVSCGSQARRAPAPRQSLTSIAAAGSSVRYTFSAAAVVTTRRAPRSTLMSSLRRYRLKLDISVERGARLVVTTAAAEKVYRTLEPAAAIEVKLCLGAGARLAWLPQETILFARARLRRAIDIDLAADAQLLLAEAIVFGRSGMGETVKEGFLFDRWRLRRDGRLMHAEAMRLDGAVSAKLAQGAVAKGGTAVATVLVAPGEQATAAS